MRPCAQSTGLSSGTRTGRHGWRFKISRRSSQASSGKKSGRGEATAFALASDWHVEERVERASVNGLNEHSLAIADRKIDSYYRHVVDLLRLNRGGVEIRTLVHPLLGDFFSGHIHEDLVEVTELSPTQAVIWLEQRISAGIRYLLEHGDLERIVVPCTIGNHGRTTKKPRIATAMRHSYEWLLYQHLRGAFSSERRVEFRIADGYHLVLDCHGLTVRLHHGDAVRYAGGVGGLTIPLNKAMSAWDKALRADLDCFGHWHQLLWLPRAVGNGSLIGYGSFSVWIKADYEPAAQAFFLIDAQHRRRTMQTPIWLE
ncbi:MAG TPA: hypothetical protein VFT98_04900 [Myxococcota bacterium]|nr:hypothetical protein [Myxococcota bacterium]